MKFSKICVILFIVVDILYIKSLVSEKVVDIYAIRSIKKTTHGIMSFYFAFFSVCNNSSVFL